MPGGIIEVVYICIATRVEERRNVSLIISVILYKFNLYKYEDRAYIREKGVVREGVRGEREACGPKKFSIPRTSQDKLQDELLLDLLQSRLSF